MMNDSLFIRLCETSGVRGESKYVVTKSGTPYWKKYFSGIAKKQEKKEEPK